LSLLAANQNIQEFMAQSMLSVDLAKEIRGYEQAQAEANELIEKKQAQLSLCRTPIAVLTQYKELNDNITHLTNSARKKARIEINNLEAEHHTIVKDLAKFAEVSAAQTQKAQLVYEQTQTAQYTASIIRALSEILTKNRFLIDSILTEKGQIAAQLQEVHPLAMTDLYESTNKFAAFTAADLAGLFSCFYPVAVSEEFRAHSPHAHPLLRAAILTCGKSLGDYLQQEQAAFLQTGANYDIFYDLLPYVVQWCESADELSCKEIIQNMKKNTGLFIGEFIKALLKVNAVALEFARVCELTLNIALLEKLRNIPHLTLKYIATNQSLYL
jgi:hypothetical protein